jgi:hypothetical protein
MIVERIETLKNYLENIPQEIIKKKKFNLNKWMAASKIRDESELPFSKIKKIKSLGQIIVEPNYCQTTGCAMGWATTIPEFKEAGLVLITGDSDIYSSHIAFKHKNKWYEHFAAAEKFFDIEYQTARILFDPTYYKFEYTRHPKYVVSRLNYLLKHGEEKLKSEYGW